MHSLSREKEVVIAHNSSSQEDVVDAEDGTPSMMEIGAIYKRTDVHVSTTVEEKRREEAEEDLEVQKKSEESEDKGKARQLSLYDFLNEEK